MSALKDIYSPIFYDRLADTLAKTVSSFEKKLFIAQIFDDTFSQKELKDRMRHTTKVLRNFMPDDFGSAADILQKTIILLRENQHGEDSLAYIFLPDYIEMYGIDDYENAVKSIEFVTQFISCEFAVRPFIIKYGDRMIDQMKKWSLHESHKVRRLASEGSRPRLPWAMALPELKKNPEALLPLLENLKNDTSEYVRRSVANSLNDIAKDHPHIVLAVAQKWKGHSKETDAIIKHGSRTLLKQGHPEILSHYGLDSNGLEITDFKIITPKVKVKESLEFAFAVKNTNDTPKSIRLEYAVYYNKANGQLSKKVFKISERIYASGQKETINRKQSFKLITTRKFYPGLHKLSLIINGDEKDTESFELAL
ncbi:3-methyladenine DNA glycosylase AlkC [Flavobacterium endophyticum]|uniref:3-methyladenine DNA glycosylase AlkC n=1 Tax=Flavobacterium endophyticum TaxID=1540163 RepID=A0A495LXK4_9FLAO|nr:DNA alkylation repair protein [Flavobacterium endophyticum]RKS17858.1 3-methyladenine DNA glycosylase AlkC [Flavobacterium endophyticum]